MVFPIIANPPPSLSGDITYSPLPQSWYSCHKCWAIISCSCIVSTQYLSPCLIAIFSQILANKDQLLNSDDRHQDYPLGDIDHEADSFYGNYGFVSSPFVVSGETIKMIAEFLSYWSQINITLAIAVERYVLIAKASQAESILNKSRRRIFYALTIIWVAVLALFYSVVKLDYFNKYDQVGNWIKLGQLSVKVPTTNFFPFFHAMMIWEDFKQITTNREKKS